MGRESENQKSQAPKESVFQSSSLAPSYCNSDGEETPPNKGAFFNFGNISTLPRQRYLLQPKLTLNTPGDKYEREADRIAAQVMRQEELPNPTKSPPTLTLQRKCTACEAETEEEEETLMRKVDSSGGVDVLPAMSSNLNATKGKGAPLSNSTRGFMEKAFGTDFSEVRVHTGGKAVEMSRRIGAKAFTTGSDLYFNQGQYRPATRDGKQLLAHELTHTLQQTGNVIHRQAEPDSEQDTARLIVEDFESPFEGQMTKARFLGQLNEAVCLTVNQELRDTPYSSDNCPYIRAAFSRHANSTPLEIEQLLARYEPQTRFADTAEELIQTVLARVQVAVNRWKQRGNLEDVPEDVTEMLTDTVGNTSSQSDPDTEQPPLLFKANPGGANPSQTPHSVMKSLGQGKAMEGTTRGRMENVFGNNFSDVEIHTDSHAARLAGEMNAKAFTVGNHIAFGSGEYRPGSLVGDALMAHELAHVLQQEGATSNGTTSENLLESDANRAATGAISNLLEMGKPGKGRASIKVKTGLQLSRCNSCSSCNTPAPTTTTVPPPTSPSPGPPASPTPTPATLTPDFQVNRLPEDTSAFTNKIFFLRGSAALEPSEETKLTHIVSTNSSTAIDLHGFTSEDEPSGLESTRITNVDADLTIKGHTGQKNPFPHPGAGTGNIDYRKVRVVEIRRAGGQTSTPSCVDSSGNRVDGVISCNPASRFTTAQTRANQMLTTAISALGASTLNPVTSGALSRFFGASPSTMATIATTVKDNLQLLKPHIATQMTPTSVKTGSSYSPGHRCADACDSICATATAYNSDTDADAIMTLCPPFMRNTNTNERAETLIHEGLHGITLTGVLSGGLPTNADDFSYDWQRVINYLDTNTALQNNDSYVLLIRQILNPGTSIHAGQEPGEEDVFNNITPGSPEETQVKRAVAWLESWFEISDQEVSALYGTIVESRDAVPMSWTNPYYRTSMSLLAPLFGLTVPPAIPTQTEQFIIAGISDRMTKIRNVITQTLTITKSTTTPTTWSAGPGTDLTVGPDFFSAPTDRDKLDLLLNKIVSANPDIPSAHKPHYVSMVDLLRQHMGLGSP